MRTWLREGRIGPDSLVWREGWRDWREAATVFAQLNPDSAGAVDVLGLHQSPRRTTLAHGLPARRRSNGAGLLLIALLFVLVLILFGVLFWTLRYQQSGQAEPTYRTPRASSAAPLQPQSGCL